MPEITGVPSTPRKKKWVAGLPKNWPESALKQSE